MKRYRVTAESTSPVMQHVNNGKDAEIQIGQLPDLEQARKHTYWMDEGKSERIALPATYFIGCLRDYMIKNSPKKMKKIAEWEYSSCFAIDPPMIDSGVDFCEEIVDRRIVPVKLRGQIVNTSIVIRPKFYWKVSFILTSSLDMSTKDLRTNLENAGLFQGIGSYNKGGFGRFRVLEFEEIK